MWMLESLKLAANIGVGRMNLFQEIQFCNVSEVKLLINNGRDF